IRRCRRLRENNTHRCQNRKRRKRCRCRKVSAPTDTKSDRRRVRRRARETIPRAMSPGPPRGGQPLQPQRRAVKKYAYRKGWATQPVGLNWLPFGRAARRSIRRATFRAPFPKRIQAGDKSQSRRGSKSHVADKHRASDSERKIRAHTRRGRMAMFQIFAPPKRAGEKSDKIG